MREELDNTLCALAPNLYRNRNGDIRSSSMPWGLDCGDGWFDILKSLSTELEAEILRLPEEDRQYVCASQVKEKYGGLRFYMSMSTDEMEWLIGEAASKAWRTCELCGNKGECRNDLGWYTTLCQACWLTQIASRIADSSMYASEHYLREITYGKRKGEYEAATRFKDEKAHKATIADMLDAYFDVLPTEEEKLTFAAIRKRLWSKLRYGTLYYMTKGYWWRQLPDKLRHKAKYRLWKFKRRWK